MDQVRKLTAALEEYRKQMFFPAGHYYSSIVNVDEAKLDQDRIWKKPAPGALRGIDLNTEEQVKLLEEFAAYYPGIRFPETREERFRYYFENPFFGYTDGIILYFMIRHFNPATIIEAGSGFSSALMLDTMELLERDHTRFIFIEPYAERLFSLIRRRDRERVSILEKKVQETEPGFFSQLEENDILFVDSTHVSKTGSDVNYLLFEVLPALKKGVLVHFHDVFYPFEYPKEWVFEGRSWNEDYILRSFLMYNDSFSILLFPDFLHRMYPESFAGMPLCGRNTGGSLWLRKVK